jgi:hypothetical protein
VSDLPLKGEKRPALGASRRAGNGTAPFQTFPTKIIETILFAVLIWCSFADGIACGTDKDLQ